MPQRRQESGVQRQERIQSEQHQPEQNQGYDEAVRGGGDAAHGIRRTDRVVPMPPDAAPDATPEDRAKAIDDRETQLAVDDVQRHEHSADRRVRSK